MIYGIVYTFPHLVSRGRGRKKSSNLSFCSIGKKSTNVYIGDWRQLSDISKLFLLTFLQTITHRIKKCFFLKKKSPGNMKGLIATLPRETCFVWPRKSVMRTGNMSRVRSVKQNQLVRNSCLHGTRLSWLSHWTQKFW